MTVYVDSAMIPATVNGIRSRWSHLTADTDAELHAFAQRLGLRRDWFQTCKRKCGPAGQPCIHWHYDVTSRRRTAALALGAVKVDMHGMGEILRARRQEQRDTRRFLVERTHDVDGHAVFDELSILNTAALIDAARRVCVLDHIHDTAEQARACTAPPADTDA